MRRLLRYALGTVIGLMTLLLAGVVAMVQPVRLDAYIRAPYAVATRERLQKTPPPPSAEGPLWVGLGRASLTPSLVGTNADPTLGVFPGIPLAGYGGRAGQPASGTQDELWARAVAFRVASQTGLVVSAEALIVPPEVATETARLLKDSHGLPREAIFLGATHTHGSFGGWGEGPVARQFAGAFQPGLQEWFARQLAAAAQEALRDLAPAAAGHGRFAAPRYVRNRLIGELGDVDSDFHFLALRQDDGDVAVVGAYAAHATVLGEEMMRFCGDWPGAWSRAVEAGGAKQALFLAGAVGSHSPVPGAPGLEGAQRMGHALATQLLQQFPSTPLRTNAVLATLGLEVDLPELQCRLTDSVRFRPWAARRLLPPRPGRTWLHALRLNDALWVGTPCDFSGELALPIKARLRELGWDPVITSFNGDYVGYVIPRRYYHLDGYEPRIMSFYGPNMPDYLEELIFRMAARFSHAPKERALGLAGSPRP